MTRYVLCASLASALVIAAVGCGSNDSDSGNGTSDASSGGGGSSGGGSGSSGTTSSSGGSGSGSASGSGGGTSGSSSGSSGGSASGSTSGSSSSGGSSGGSSSGDDGGSSGSGSSSGSSSSGGDAGACDGSGPLPWPEANTIVCDVQNHLPQIPNNTCSVKDAGAKGDGTTDDTMAFVKAIATCEGMGGGHVDVPAGTYSTGAIHLDNNIDLHFEMGATIMFNGNVSEYPMVLTRYQGTGLMNNSPMVYAYQKHDISVTGPGVLDASKTPTFSPRVNFFEPYSCQNVLIKDITLQHSHFWQFHPTLVTYLWAENVTTTDDGTSNNDGFDPESCTNCVVTNSTIQSHDDAMAIKSGRDDYGRMINVPTSNLVVMHSSFSSSWGLMTLGSELSGGIHNVYYYDVKTTGPGVKYAFEIKGNTLRGGTVKEIHMDTLSSMGGVHGGVVWADMEYMNQTGMYTPDYENFSLSHATVSGAPFVLDFSRTTPGSTIKNFAMSDCTFTNIGSTATPAPNTMVTWTNCTINGTPKM